MTEGKSIWRGYLLLGTLCVLAASRWMVTEAAPGTASTLSSQALGSVLAAALWGGWLALPTGRQKQQVGLDPKAFGLRTLGLTLALAGPVLGEAVAGHHPGAGAVSIALACVPTMVALGSAITNESGNFDLVGAMWPGLAALAGLLLLLPQPSFSSWRMWLGWALMPLLTSLGAVLSQTAVSVDRSGDQRESWTRPISLLSSAALLGALVVTSHVTVSSSLLSAGLDAATIVAGLGALSELGPLRWSAQFALIPLLGFGEGLLLLRPAVGVRSWAALGFIAIGVFRLLSHNLGDEDTGPWIGAA